MDREGQEGVSRSPLELFERDGKDLGGREPGRHQDRGLLASLQ